MRKVLMVVRREYLAAVKTKMFWIGTLLIPFGMMALIGLSILAQLVSTDSQRPIAVIERGETMTRVLDEGLADRKLDGDVRQYPVEHVDPGGDLEATIAEQKSRVLDGSVWAVVAVGDDLDAAGNFRIFRKSVGDDFALDKIGDVLSDGAIEIRLSRSELDLDREELDALMKRVRLESFQVTASGEAEKRGMGAALIPTFAFVIILFMTLYFYGYAMARGVIQEKTTKVMEVLLGSLSPEQLMAGKVFGIGLVGLTQMAIYGIAGTGLRMAVLLYADLDIPEEVASTIKTALGAGTLGYFLLFFLLGYFLYTGLFAIVGAVCSTEQDAQSLQFPIMMCLMLPYLMTFFFVRNPDSTAAVVSSFIPLFTPMVMFMRISVLTPPFWQIGLSILLTIGAILLVNKAAAKIFRIGTLMTGKRPGVKEILRWARS